jgi:hypothetical protein
MWAWTAPTANGSCCRTSGDSTPGDNAESYARDVIDSILQGLTPDELGVTLDD